MSRTWKQRQDPRQACLRKVRHSSEAAATAEAARINRALRAKDDPQVVRMYPCMHCHGWHVGRLPRAAARRQLSFEQRTPVLIKGQAIPPKVEG